jgi:hypothetical protein
MSRDLRSKCLPVGPGQVCWIETMDLPASMKGIRTRIWLLTVEAAPDGSLLNKRVETLQTGVEPHLEPGHSFQAAALHQAN